MLLADFHESTFDAPQTGAELDPCFLIYSHITGEGQTLSCLVRLRCLLANDITLSPPIERHTRLKGETLPQGFRDYGLSFDGYGAGHGKSFQLWLTNFKAKKS